MNQNPHDIPLYHITHIDNLPGILESGGLWCDKKRMEQRFQLINIAHEPLKGRRLKTGVPLFPGMTLGDFVPFYFTNRSPMLYAIHSGFVEGYSGGQGEVIYLVTTIGRILTGDREWCFTDGHAVEAVTDFFNSLEGLKRIEWELVSGWSWHNTLEDNDRKRRKQAEFLVKDFTPWQWINQVAVYDIRQKSNVERIINIQGHHTTIRVEPKWYY
jgi:hypothetical protein